MGETQQYPIGVSQNVLQAQLQAIALLESRVAGLIAQTSWPVHIPFAPKAAAKGKIVHTNDLKVNLGAGIWVEMTAAEAVQYLQRHRQRIIETHLRKTGNYTVSAVPQIMITNGPESAARVYGSLQTSTDQKVLGSRASETSVVPAITVSDETNQRSKTPKKTSETTRTESPKPITHSIEQPSQPGQPLKDVDLVSLVQDLAQEGSGDGVGNKGDVIKDDSILNEDGLPFLEIRETSDQRDELVNEAASLAKPSLLTNIPSDLYWTEEAKKRRAELLRKVLGDGEDEDENADEDAQQQGSSTLLPAIPSTEVETGTITKPKSILKPPARKKSVSFEEDTSISTSGLSDLPLKPIAKPAVSPAVTPPQQGPFAGFKRGFLSSPLKQEIKTTPDLNIVELPTTDQSPVAASSAPASTSEQSVAPLDSASAPKKKSLFALRKAQMTAPKTEARVLPEKAVGKPTLVTGATPRLPKASSSKPMTSMKNSVVERVPETPASKTVRRAKTESDSDMSEYSDLEDDDMDIDQALLAREVALEYHKRRSMIPVHNDEGTLEGDEWDRETGQGRWSTDYQTRLGLPRLTDKDGQPIDVGMGDLVHVSELNAHIRVGKLENGKLVVAAGDDSDDTEAEEDDIDEERRAKREIKKQLLGGPPSRPTPKATTPAAKVQERRTEALDPEISLRTDPARTAPSNTSVGPEPPAPRDPPAPAKKVSRFKQARAAAQQ